MSDQDRISPYNINTISTRQMMRVKKTISLGIVSGSNAKFFKHCKNCMVDSKENYKFGLGVKALTLARLIS